MVMLKLVGRPLKFENPEDLRQVIAKYFEDTDPEEWTVTGIALVVGSKQLLNDYEGRDTKDQNGLTYKQVVRQAKLMVENAYEISLRKHGRSGDIFALKNFGWEDKRDTNHSGSIGIFIDEDDMDL